MSPVQRLTNLTFTSSRLVHRRTACTISGTPAVETSNTTYTVTAVMSGVTYQTLGDGWIQHRLNSYRASKVRICTSMFR